MFAGTAAGLLHAKEPHHDVIRLDSEYQTIENFSASDCWSMQKLGTWSLPNRNRVADLLFSQTGGIGHVRREDGCEGGKKRFPPPRLSAGAFDIGVMAA